MNGLWMARPLLRQVMNSAWLVHRPVGRLLGRGHVSENRHGVGPVLTAYTVPYNSGLFGPLVSC